MMEYPYWNCSRLRQALQLQVRYPLRYSDLLQICDPMGQVVLFPGGLSMIGLMFPRAAMW